MNRVVALLVLFGAIFLVAPLTALAAPITVPGGLHPGDHYRLAFVTNATRNATSSDIADYNAFVTAAASTVPELAALGTTWKAIASTPDIDARDNTETNPSTNGVPIYTLGDTYFASSNVDLWNPVSPRFLNYTETAAFINPDIVTRVWTGTGTDGRRSAIGVLGGNPTVAPAFGRVYSSGPGGWIADAPNVVITSPTRSLRMYAMSGVLTVAVPEPGTLVLACLAAAGLAVSSLGRISAR